MSRTSLQKTFALVAANNPTGDLTAEQIEILRILKSKTTSYQKSRMEYSADIDGELPAGVKDLADRGLIHVLTTRSVKFSIRISLDGEALIAVMKALQQ